MKYRYPAIFTPEEVGYSVLFPDLEGCYTCGDDLADALDMAEDVLTSTLYSYEERRRDIPAPSARLAVNKPLGEFVRFISCDTKGYGRYVRTETRPSSMNTGPNCRPADNRILDGGRL